MSKFNTKTNHKCSECRKTFSSKAYLSSHILMHDGEKPYVCNICNKKFSLKGSLNAHIVSHRGEKPHVCNICNRSFALKGHLNVHLLTHSEVKPYVCKICDKRFSLKGSLNSHLVTHSGNRRHVCQVCNKSFYQKGSLNAHLLIHSGERPHVCNICNKSFTLKGTLSAHLLTHREVKPHVCTICKESFSQKWEVNVHSVIHLDENGLSDVDEIENISDPGENERNCNDDSYEEGIDTSRINSCPEMNDDTIVITKEEHDVNTEDEFYHDVTYEVGLSNSHQGIETQRWVAKYDMHNERMCDSVKVEQSSENDVIYCDELEDNNVDSEDVYI
ncbi:hypothetical protein SK128_010497 [Halocaridina rubra]|uniref:C2H2-type domain-containing protein n=1 Tax=Halocaridina rubra TaxID=373956 RepID=A0AAN9A4W9_HALRR